ncbi:MAG: ABC transporter permease [Chloroflexi bacterium]|nr:ABC transporter permease [Chloroflexota bacterium]
MNWQIVKTLVLKDINLYFKNQFFALVTVLGVVAYSGIYYLMPSVVDETLEMGIFAPGLTNPLAEELAEEGLVLTQFESEAALKTAVIEAEFPVGIAVADDFMEKLTADENPEIRIYVTDGVPPEFQEMYALVFRELSFMLAGRPLTIEATEEVLGVDRVGDQIPPRNRMLPLLGIFILMVETLGLASLISMEVESGTLGALLVTPLKVEGLFVGKGIFGTALAFVQVAVLMAIVGGLSREPALILTALLLGSFLVTGLGFMMASVSKDLMSVMGWGILAILVLAIPSLNVLIPGLVTNWIKIIPSFYLVDTVHRVINFDASWGDVGGNLLALLAFGLAFMALGILALRRKFR